MSLADAVAALSVLAGCRIQRLDRIGDRTLVIEVRAPGRTVKVWVSAEGNLQTGVVDARPERTVEGGDLQRFLRKRLVGQAWIRLSMEGPRLKLELSEWDVWFAARPRWIELVACTPSRIPPDPGPIPDRFGAAEVGAEGPDRGAELARELGRRLRARLKKLDRLHRKVAADLDRAQRLTEAGRLGELLKSVLHEVQRGDPSVSVYDWEIEDWVEVPLDPELGPTDNLQRLFDRSKKGTRGLPVARGRLDEVERSRTEIRQALERLQATPARESDLRADFARWLPESTAAASRPEARRPTARGKWEAWARRYTAIDGSEVHVGKNARSNDRLTAAAKGDDLWLHARGVPGAHVVVPQRGGHRASPDAVIDAAHLAVHFSDAKGESKAEVVVTEARHVKKTKGAAPGLVGVSKSRTLLVTMESERIGRLLEHVGPYAVREEGGAWTG